MRDELRPRGTEPTSGLRTLQAVYDRLLGTVLRAEVGAFLAEVVESAGQLLEAELAYLTLLDPASGEPAVAACRLRGAWATLQGMPRQGAPPGSWVRAFDGDVITGLAPVIVPACAQAPEPYVTAWLDLEPRPATVVGVPLLLRERAIGSLTLAMAEPREIAPDEVGALGQLVIPAILSVENDRLQASVRRRLREQEVLLAGCQSMVGVLDVHELLEALALHMTRVVEGSGCIVLMRRGDSFVPEVMRASVESSVACLGGPSDAALEPRAASGARHVVALQESPLLRAVVRSAQLCLLEGTEVQGDPLHELVGPIEGAAVACPLVFQAGVLGLAVLTVPASAELHLEADGRLLWALSGQAASALANAQLLADEQRRSREKALLLEAARAAASPLDSGAGLARLAELTARSLEVEACALYLLEASGTRLALAASHGFAVGGDGLTSLPLVLIVQPEGIIAEALASRLPRFSSLAPRSGTGAIERALARAAGVTSMLVWPVHAREMALGVVVLSPAVEEEALLLRFDLAEAVVRQLSVHVQNSRLFREVRLRAERQKAISDITESINETLDVATIFTTLVRNMRSLVPADYTALGVLSRTRDRVELPVIRWGEDEGYHPPQIYSVRGSLVDTAVTTHKVVVCDELSQVERTPLEAHLLASGLRCCLVVPVELEHSVRAVLLLGYRQAASVRPDQVEVLREMAAHLATALKNADMVEEIRRINDELRHREAAKSDFFSMVAHDLRTPLTIIKGFLYVLMRADEASSYSADTLETLETMDLEADHLKELIENLISLSHLEALQGSTVPLQRRVTALAEVAREVLQGFRGLARRNGIELVAEVPDGLRWPVDRALVVRLLYNLLGNALKFTRQGRVTLRLEPRPGEVLCAVSDTGPGIAPEHLEHIFERFYHVDEVGGNRVHGTGLGLSIVAAIVQAHGGRAWVESELGKGTTFWFTLAAHPAGGRSG